MIAEPIASFDDFWPHYVRAHQKPLTRALHYVGTSAALGCLVGGVLGGRPLLLLAAPVVGYAPAWLGHFVLEGNRPATFAHPLYSLAADLKMLSMALRGQMADEVARICSADGGPVEVGPSAASDAASV